MDGESLSGPAAESPWETGLSDLKEFVDPEKRVQGRGFAFNAARTAELIWRRFGPGQGFDRRSDLRLDVVIPVAPDDTVVLPLTIAGLRRNLMHPLGKITVVTVAGSEAHKVAAELGCAVVDEDTVLPVRRTDIEYRVEYWGDRSGWLFAQLLKLSADKFSAEDHILVLDADTVMIRPQTFTHRGAVVALVSKEYHLPYFIAYNALFDEPPVSRLSFIAHHSVMNRQTLTELRALIERRRDRPWWRAILDVSDLSIQSCFAEYEVYGNYILSRNKPIVRRWWRNRPLARDHMSSLDDLQLRYGAQFRTVSFHHYLGK